MKDLEKFKDYLLPYLQAKKIDVSKNPIFCFNPDHNNIHTESMTIYNNHFKCLGGCGISGDIYDACKILTGITDLNEQFLEVERTIKGFNESDIKPIKRLKTIIDKKASEKIESYMLNHGGREKGTIAFLKERGYSPEIIDKMKIKFGYWPGSEQGEKTFDALTLRKAGIPEFTWYHSGVVIKLHSGFKLFWYGRDKEQKYGCQKMNSLSASAFPSPFTKVGIKGTVIITEAELSTLSMRAAGIKNVFSSGSVQGITKINANLLEKCDKIILAFDGDNPGQYMSGLAKTLINKKTGKETTPQTTPDKIYIAGFSGKIYAANLPDGKDPDDLVRSGDIKQLKEIIKSSIFIEKPDIKKKPPAEKKNKDPDKIPFRFLGFDHRYYYFYPDKQQIVLTVGRGDNSLKNFLFEIADKDFWFSRFLVEAEIKGQLKTFFDKAAAMEWIRAESIKKGLFDPNKIKGVGAHLDNNKIIINTGTQIKTSSNKFIAFDVFEGENIYVRSKRRFSISGKPWSEKEGVFLWNQINTFSFEQKLDLICVLGFIVLSPFSGILYRRPSIWITAASGIGKSFLLEEFMLPGSGGENLCLNTEGLSSEAYIRQSLKKDAVPVFIDEFEAHEKKDKMLQKSVLKINRSSYGGNTTGKGSTSHDPIEFDLKSMFCFGSVGVAIDVEADESRIHICRLRKNKGQAKKIPDFEGLRVRTFSSLKKILRDIDTCKELLTSNGLSNRIGDTYAPLLCGAWSAISNDPFLKGNNKEFFKFFDFALNELAMKESKNDEDKIIGRLLHQRMRIDTQSELTISEMLTFTRKTNADPDDLNWGKVKNINDNEILYYYEIQRYGLKRYIMKTGKEVLAISLSSSDISAFLADTPFSEYQEILQRSDLVLYKSFNVRMSGTGTKSIIFDWQKFAKKYL